MEKEFIDLVNNNRALIFKVCNLYCRDREIRQDLFQEVVLQLWKSFPGFRNESSGSTWIYRVALNTAISNFRKDSTKPGQKPISRIEIEIPDMSDPDDSKENKNILHMAIARLSDIEKAIIMLYLDERTYDEISEIAGISVSNVGVRINRIKTKLSTIVKTY